MTMVVLDEDELWPHFTICTPESRPHGIVHDVPQELIDEYNEELARFEAMRDKIKPYAGFEPDDCC